MSLARARWQHFLAQTREIALGLDGTINACAGMASFLWSLLLNRPLPNLHYAEETVSAHLYRRHRDGSLWGLALMPVVDVVFALWQRDEQGRVVWDHCHQAYLKEMARVYLPPEYRQPPDATKGPRQ